MQFVIHKFVFEICCTYQFCLKHKLIKIQSFKISKAKKYNKQIDICDICLSQLVIHVVYIQLHQYHSSYRPIFQVNFISYNNKWEIFWVPGTGLDEEFVPPTVQRFECVWHCDIKHKNTTVSSPVERHTQRLKSLLSRCIPNL